MGTTRGSYLPDIDPEKHPIDDPWSADNPLVFTMDELKRLLPLLECISSSAPAIELEAR